MTVPSLSKTGLLIAGLLSLPFAAFGAVTLAQWTFEQSRPTAGGPLRPETGEGSAIGQSAGMWTNPVGNGSGESWSVSQWTPGDYFQFMVSGEEQNFFEISWSQISSSTGPRDFSLSYSLDGINYVWLVDFTVNGNVTPNNWSYGASLDACKYTMELQFDRLCEGPIFFRITSVSSVATNNNFVNIGGASRIDDFTVIAGRP